MINNNLNILNQTGVTLHHLQKMSKIAGRKQVEPSTPEVSPAFIDSLKSIKAKCKVNRDTIWRKPGAHLSFPPKNMIFQNLLQARLETIFYEIAQKLK